MLFMKKKPKEKKKGAIWPWQYNNKIAYRWSYN
jgi:hypothetical protein